MSLGYLQRIVRYYLLFEDNQHLVDIQICSLQETLIIKIDLFFVLLGVSVCSRFNTLTSQTFKCIIIHFGPIILQ